MCSPSGTAQIYIRRPPYTELKNLVSYQRPPPRPSVALKVLARTRMRRAGTQVPRGGRSVSEAKPQTFAKFQETGRFKKLSPRSIMASSFAMVWTSHTARRARKFRPNGPWLNNRPSKRVTQCVCVGVHRQTIHVSTVVTDITYAQTGFRI